MLEREPEAAQVPLAAIQQAPPASAAQLPPGTEWDFSQADDYGDDVADATAADDIRSGTPLPPQDSDPSGGRVARSLDRLMANLTGPETRHIELVLI
jgi:hypothetical protein